MRKHLVGWVTFLVGLFLVLRVTAHLIHDAENYPPGAADCDDCGVTILLDNIGWLGLAAVAYLALALLVVRVLRVGAARHRD